jgi:hypothetical protein
MTCSDQVSPSRVCHPAIGQQGENWRSTELEESRGGKVDKASSSKIARRRQPQLISELGTPLVLARFSDGDGVGEAVGRLDVCSAGWRSQDQRHDLRRPAGSKFELNRLAFIVDHPFRDILS